MSTVDADAVLLPDVAGALADVDAGGGAVVLLLEEHAASRSAAPIAVTPNAARVIRGLCFLILKRSMRPRICYSGSYRLDHQSAQRLDLGC
jgi:hypothetical protein